jgi:hypothetical protein
LRNASNLPGPAGSSISSKITEDLPSKIGAFFSIPLYFMIAIPALAAF